VIWFDDDSFPYRPDWLPGFRLRMETQPDVDVWGNPFFTDADEAAVRFIRTAAWFRGKPFNHPFELGLQHPNAYDIGGYSSVGKRNGFLRLAGPLRLSQNVEP